MPYIYSNIDDLDGRVKVGSKQCVALLQHYAKLHQTALWKEGKSVVGDISIIKGTAIATFVNGKYPNLSSGNHAAFYISQDVGGIWIMDQWADDGKKKKSRLITSEEKASLQKAATLIQVTMLTLIPSLSDRT